MGTLHIVSTPIGNLEDVTLRSLRVLREADWILAEDTRRTRILLDHFEIAKTPSSLHAHNESARIAEVEAALAEGRNVALVSDAGTPLVSDPGARLVAALAAAGHRIEAVPGASALLAALCVSGLATQRVLFLGFLPRKAGLQARIFARQRDRDETLVLFESPHRVAATFASAARALGDRPACLGRELTKRHEEVLRGTLVSLAAHCAENPPRGECTLVIAGADPNAPAPADDRGGEAGPDDAGIEAGAGSEVDLGTDDEALDRAIDGALAAGESVRDLAARLAALAGRPRGSVYTRALARREQRDRESASARAADAIASTAARPAEDPQ